MRFSWILSLFRIDITIFYLLFSIFTERCQWYIISNIKCCERYNRVGSYFDFVLSSLFWVNILEHMSGIHKTLIVKGIQNSTNKSKIYVQFINYWLEPRSSGCVILLIKYKIINTDKKIYDWTILKKLRTDFILVILIYSFF